MNILFVLYHDFTANSASHIGAFADELQKMGHDCCVAVPFKKETISRLGTTSFQSMEFSELAELHSFFANGSGPDVLHAWTPREIVRSFSEAVLQEFPCHLFIHLEDNEWHITECALNRKFKDLLAMRPDDLDELIRPNLSHPHRAMDFMRMADGITVIIDRLAELAPPQTPKIEVWPAADPRLFSAQPRFEQSRRALGIPLNSTVISYTGNAHYANAHEMRSLYLAVAILNREGFPTTLVRAGRDFYPFLGPGEEWGRRYAIELGLVPFVDIPSVLALADVLVQPGKPDEFNDYRFPSKLPEFLSAGRPVVLPNTNIGRYMTHRKHGYLLDDPSGVAIAEAVKEIMSDKQLYATLSEGSLEFSRLQLSWPKSALKLHHFYMQNGGSKRAANLTAKGQVA